MPPEILVYGHADKSEKGFPTPEALEEYISGGVFRNEHGRYHYSQRKHADTIVLARDGLAFGHFDVDSMEDPSEEDRKAYPPVKKVYLIRKSVLYGNRVRLLDLGISRYQFGRRITEQQFNEILALAGKTNAFQPYS